MNNMPKISVVVPVYKVEPFLRYCLDSILGQTFSDFELLLVDDGSPDNCGRICDEYAARDRRVRVIHKANGGLSDARNAGMAIATGEYLSFVDSDDWLAPGMLENLYQAAVSTESQVACCGYLRVAEESECFLDSTKEASLTCYQTEEALKLLIEGRIIQQIVWNKLYLREIADPIPFEIGKQHEDSFWTHQVMGNAKRIVLTDYVGYFYRKRNDSIMSEGLSLKSLDAIEARIKRIEYFQEKYPALVPYARNNLRGMCIYQGQKALRSTKLDKETKRRILLSLKKAFRDYNRSFDDIRILPLKKKLWFVAARISFIITCKVKNTLRIGV